MSSGLLPYVPLFERIRRGMPDAPAVQDARRRLSYAQLDQLANRFAAEMRARGVGKGSIVAISRERDALSLVAMIAVFKLRAAYLPVDPQLPPARKRFMVETCACALALFDAPQDLELESFLPASIPSADPSAWEAMEPLEQLVEQAQGELEDLAYVIFTSGSTGRPKGAMLSQRSMVNHLWAKIEDLEISSEDVLAQTASHGFDLSVWQYLAAGLVGAHVCVLSRDEVAYVPALLDALGPRRISVLQAVPSYLSAMLDLLEAHPAPLATAGLRIMVVAGETLPMPLVRRWFALQPIPIVNAYGPTECGADVTHHVMREAPAGDHVPIGRAVRGALLEVVDENLKSVPDGESGELLIGGVAMGLGYLNAPEQTAGAFVDGPAAGAKRYRSGDLVRRQGAVYEFLGRLDHQLKLRGHRIEPGEIETVLRQDEGVRAAVVLLYQDGARAELVAVVEDRELPEPAALADRRESLMQRLRTRLPHYMVPHSIEFAYALPLNVNGKIDRGAVMQFLHMLKPFHTRTPERLRS